MLTPRLSSFHPGRHRIAAASRFLRSAEIVCLCLGIALLCSCSKPKPEDDTRFIVDKWAAPPEPKAAPDPTQPADTTQPPGEEPPPSSGPVRLTVKEGTEGMAALLAQIEALAPRAPSRYHNEIRANDWLQALAAQTDPEQAVAITGDAASELLLAGRTREAIGLFQRLQEDAAKFAPDFLKERAGFLKFNQALAHLRLAEQENCIANHSAESCVFPIAGGGVHQLREGSTEAMRLLQELLEEAPENLPAAWLLNIAAMTLDQHPDAVPEPFRLPPSALKSDYDIKRFPDIAHQLGVGLNGLAGGVVVEDFDHNGYLDLMVSSWSLKDQLRLFLNQGDGSFKDATESAGITGITGGLNMVHADYNNDGHIDVFVLRGAWREKVGNYPNSLLRNNGDGTFTDVTKKARLLSLHPTQTAAWLDYDNDGWLDLFIANESVGPIVNPCELYRNRGDGTFVNIANPCGVAFVGLFKGVTAGDFNNDGRTDLYLSRMLGPNLLLRNDGPVDDPKAAGLGAWKFAEIAEKAGVAAPKFSFPCWFFDYDNDGWLDLFVSDYDIGSAASAAAYFFQRPANGETARLYRNKGDGTFEDVSSAAGVGHTMLSMGSSFGDLDNDGWLDFLLGSGAPDLSYLFPNRMFRNNHGRGFQDVTFSGGFGQLQKGHGVAFADLDNDGDQDVYAVIGGAYSGDVYYNALHQNPGHGANAVKIRLRGDKSNRGAIGARLKLTVVEDGVARAIHRVVGGNGSFGGNPLLQEIGIGKATEVRELKIYWPTSGTTQQFEKLSPGMTHTITEGSETIESSPLKAVKFALKPGHHHR